MGDAIHAAQLPRPLPPARQPDEQPRHPPRRWRGRAVVHPVPPIPVVLVRGLVLLVAVEHDPRDPVRPQAGQRVPDRVLRVRRERTTIKNPSTMSWIRTVSATGSSGVASSTTRSNSRRAARSRCPCAASPAAPAARSPPCPPPAGRSRPAGPAARARSRTRRSATRPGRGRAAGRACLASEGRRRSASTSRMRRPGSRASAAARPSETCSCPLRAGAGECQAVDAARAADVVTLAAKSRISSATGELGSLRLCMIGNGVARG